MTARPRVAVSAVFSVLALFAAFTACDETPSDRKDGQSCSQDGDCMSSDCVESSCSGSTCDFSTGSCEAGWDCTRTAAGATTGLCKQKCGGKPSADPCEDGRVCKNAYCEVSNDKLAVNISATGRCAATTNCFYSVEVSNGSGKLSGIVVDFGDGASASYTESGAEWTAAPGIITLLISHVYQAEATYTARATATDVRDGAQNDSFDNVVTAAPSP